MQKDSHITPKKFNPYKACALFRKQDGYCTALQHGRQSEENTRSNKISINEAPKVLITMVK